MTKKEKDAAKAARWRKKHPRRHLNSVLKMRYGIDADTRDRMLEEQEGVCAICGEEDERSLCVDHDHETGKVRALLCHDCNKSLGFYEKRKHMHDHFESYIGYHRSKA